MKRLTLLILLIFSTLTTAENTIRLIVNNWTSQVVLSHVTAKLLERQGLDVELTESSVTDQWGALSHGAAHFQMEVWEGTMSAKFNRLVKAKRILDLGFHNAKTREEWWYPSYVEALCPGLPDWKALKACSSIFSKTGEGKGVYIAGPWEKPDEARIRALDLNFKVEVVSNGDDLWEKLKIAYSTKRPIVLFNWTPNWVESRFDGKFIEFPNYEHECEKNPKWGINPNFIHDCGNPKGGWLKKAGWSGVDEMWPCATRLIRNINLNNQQISNMSALVDVDGLSHEAAADKWIKNNTKTWQSWMVTNCNHD